MPSIVSPTTTNIFVIRSKARLTQTEFGQLFGISKGFVSKIENGTTRPSQELLDRIAAHYQIEDPNWLLKRMDRRVRLV